MSMSEDDHYITESYDEFFGYLIRDDYLEAHEIWRDLDGFLGDEAPSEYEIDRALEAVFRNSENVDIVEVDGGNIYDTSDFSIDDHYEIEAKFLQNEDL